MVTLHLICGLPGSGKSTLARRLEEEGAGVRFTPDEWLIDLGFGLYEAPARDRVEALQWRLAQRLLESGQSVILENGFWSKEERLRYRAAAEARGATTRLHFLDVPLHELQARVAERNRTVPADQAVWIPHLAEWFATFEPPEADELETS